MNLEKHISTLLYNHDCVVVPEFGAFIAQKSNAGYVPETSVFSPPFKKIIFNPSLTMNDGLLTKELTKSGEISFEKAKEVVENTVQFWKKHLQMNSTLALSDLGTFSQDENGLLHFVPGHQNYLLDSFGLESIRAKYILSKQSEENNSSAWWKAAAIVPILIGGFLYFGKPQPVTDFVNQQWSGFVSPVMNPNTEATVAIESPIKAIEKEATTYKNEVLTVHDHQVISGSFRKLEEADAQVEKLQKLGFEQAKMTQKKGNFYYVAFKTFPTKEDAQAYRKTVSEEFPETWVLSLKD